MNGLQRQVAILTTLLLVGNCCAEVVSADPPASTTQPVPILQPTHPPPLPALSPSSQPEMAPIKLIAPASGINPEPDAASPQAEAYTVTAGDRIAVTIANIPEFSGQYQVQVDGSVDFPVIGAISVWGLTVSQIAELLTTRYVQAEILRDPAITVSVLTVSPLRIAVSGEVNRPGSYNISSADGKLPTLTEAIQKAGGITEQADLRQVKLIRVRRSGADETFQINLWELLRSGDLRQDTTLRDGDSIVLATAATPVHPTEAGLLGAATVSPPFIQVGILGETRQSGVVQVPPNTPLNQAILAAGGFNNRARKGSVELIRLNRDGSVNRRKIRVDFSQGINEATNPILHNRDVVLVGRNFWAGLSDGLTSVLDPVNQVFSVYTLFKALFPASSDGSANGGSSGSSIIIPAGGSTSTPTTAIPVP
ncbi:SLBB domain-containing protein [Pantanalinema rosaneae CENA516]|uniref:SLBB domain-containing protein n=1 Tax=Pantanalinema rosaneae TaxID=1620701 RepID=UPI003D6FAB7A